MAKNAIITPLPSGVPGLDEVLGGGIPELSFNLIAGEPGSGKTTLAHHLMFALATPDRPALYLTVLGEPPLKQLRHQQQFAFFDANMINRSVRFLNLTDEALADDFDQLFNRIVVEVEAHNPAFVFIDSYRSMMLVNTAQDAARQKFLLNLATTMTSWQATTFLIGEYAHAINIYDEPNPNPVFTVADGLIWLQQSVKRNSVVRKIEVSKMRGLPTPPGVHSFRITAAGVQIFAPAIAGTEKPPAGITERSFTSRAKLGIAQLDAMMGGGIPRAYSLLVAGPSGSGKSILGSAFLAEGARHGETGVIAAFDQHPNRARRRVVAKLIESGQVALVNTRSPDLSIDEILWLLLHEIRRIKATRVVIDSLSGFEITLAPTFREDFRESMLRMVTTLTDEGVTVMMTCELEDRYTDLRFSPYGTAFLTDAIIVQRYVEIESRLKRVLAVVKMRGSEHSDELRQYSIEDGNIRMGDALSDHEGQLVGKPTRKPDSAEKDQAS